MEKQQVLNTIRKKHAQSINKTTEDATQTHMHMHALHYTCMQSSYVKILMLMFRCECVSLSLSLFVCVFLFESSENCLHYCCSISFIMLRRCCFCCCCCCCSQPKGQRTHTRFFFGVCFVSAVPLRASEIARLSAKCRLKNWQKTRKWNNNTKLTLKSMRISLFFFFNFFLCCCLCESEIRIVLISFIVVVVSIALINLHNICKAPLSKRVCSANERDNNKNNSHLYIVYALCACVCVRVFVHVYACLVGPMVNRGQQAATMAAGGRETAMATRRCSTCDSATTTSIVTLCFYCSLS